MSVGSDGWDESLFGTWEGGVILVGIREGGGVPLGSWDGGGVSLGSWDGKIKMFGELQLFHWQCCKTLNWHGMCYRYLQLHS